MAIEAIAGRLLEVFGVVALHRATELIVTDREALKRVLSHSTVHRSRRLRVSMAAILSLEVGDRFVLIDSTKRRGRVAPIGGVVRYFRSAIPVLEGQTGFQPEVKTGPERYDLRGYLLGKQLAAFLRWYATGQNRENSALAREIEEELDEIGVRNAAGAVNRPEFVLERVVHEGPYRVQNRDYWQYRYFDVYRLSEESDVSKKLADFIRLQVKRNNGLVAVSTDDIRIGKLRDGRIIGDSAAYLFTGPNTIVTVPPLV